MKRHVVKAAAVMVCAVASTLFAQISLQPGVAIGTSIFKQTGTETGGGAIDRDFRTALVFGGSLDVSILHYLSIEPGIFLSMRGGTRGTPDGTRTDKLSYLSIPIHARVIYPSFLIKPYAVVGGSFGALLTANAITSTAGGTGNTEQDLANDFKTADGSIDLGIGAELTLPKFSPFIEATYYIGVLNVADPNNSDDLKTVKNSGMEIKGGLRFSL
jgi:hypothetical protein